MTDRNIPAEAIIRRLERNSQLPSEARSDIQALGFTIRTLRQGDRLLARGDPILMCSILLAGFAYRSNMTFNGDRQIMSVHVPGDLVDLQNLGIDRSDHDLVMLTDGEVAQVSRADLVDIMFENRHLGTAILREILIDASIYREWLLNIGQRSALERVAHLICEFCVRLEKVSEHVGHGYTLPMTQDQMGDALGLTSVHVNRMLRQLEVSKLIKRAGRLLTIPDWRALKLLGNFSDEYLHLGDLP